MAVIARDLGFVRDACTLFRRGDAVIREHAPALAAEIAALDARIDLSHTIAGLESNLARSLEGLDRARPLGIVVATGANFAPRSHQSQRANQFSSRPLSRLVSQ